MKPKIGILNLGCARNLTDAESALGRLQAKGYSITDIGKADIAIVNTCCFIEDAKCESIDAILDLVELKKQGRLKKIIVSGCLSQRYQNRLIREIPEVDCWIGRSSLNHALSRFRLTPRHYAYLKICESCINNCTYCIIPKIKGKFTSLEEEAVLKRVGLLERERISELNIIGQDISGYGLDLSRRRELPKIVKKIAQSAKTINWIRLLYLYPHPIIERLLEVMKAEPRICKYIDLPIQHINDRILKLMRRNTTKLQIMSLIEKIRKEFPQAAIRTSVIVGFPSETEQEFLELVEFIKAVKFERLGAFIYSREEGTPAYSFNEQIPRSIKIRRFDAVMSAQRTVSLQVNEKFLGKTIKVLIDEKGQDYYLGRSEYDAPEVDGLVYVKSKKELQPGDFVQVKITDTLDYDLTGEVE